MLKIRKKKYEINEKDEKLIIYLFYLSKKIEMNKKALKKLSLY